MRGESATSRHGVLALVTSIGALVTGAAWNYPALLVGDLLRDLSLQESDWGVLWAGIPAGLMLFSLPAGTLGDRLGVRIVLALGLIVVAASLGLRSGASGFVSLLITMVGVGAGLALILANLPKALAQLFPAQELGLANGVSQAGVGLGLGATFWLTPQLAATGTSWRALSLWLAVAVGALAVAWWLAVRDSERVEPGPLLAPLADVLRVPDVIRIALCYALYLAGYLGAIGYLHTHLTHTRGLSAVDAGAALALGPWSFLVGSLVLPALSDRLGRRRWVYCAGMAVGGAALFAASQVSGAGLALGIATLGFATGVIGLVFVIPAELPEVGVARAGSAIGVATLAGFLGGSLSSWAGVRLAQQSAVVAFGLWAACLLGSALLALLIRETGRRRA